MVSTDELNSRLEWRVRSEADGGVLIFVAAPPHHRGCPPRLPSRYTSLDHVYTVETMAGTRSFNDRTDAGEQLAAALRERSIEADLVLAIPRGGLPLGRAVADTLDAPLDVVVAKKIGAPGQPEYAMGAVASDGSVWRNEEAFLATGADEEYFQKRAEIEAEHARKKADRYRGGRPEPELSGRRIVVVDDGVATGSTARACLHQLAESETERVVLAVPVGPPSTIEALEALTDEVVCLETPPTFRGVGQFYRRFDQVSDEEAMAYLEAGS